MHVLVHLRGCSFCARARSLPDALGPQKDFAHGECPSFFALPGPTPGAGPPPASAGTPTHVHKASHGGKDWMSVGTYVPGKPKVGGRSCTFGSGNPVVCDRFWGEERSLGEAGGRRIGRNWSQKSRKRFKSYSFNDFVLFDSDLGVTVNRRIVSPTGPHARSGRLLCQCERSFLLLFVLSCYHAHRCVVCAIVAKFGRCRRLAASPPPPGSRLPRRWSMPARSTPRRYGCRHRQPRVLKMSICCPHCQVHQHLPLQPTNTVDPPLTTTPVQPTN